MKHIKTKGFEIAVYKQGNKNSKKLMLCLPGRLDTKDYPHMKSHVEYFAKKGYLALSFDPPGTWESPGSIALYTMTNYLKVIDELITYFGNRPTVLFGHSRGGTVAMIAGTQNNAVTHIIAIMSHMTSSKAGKGKMQGGVEISLRDTPPNDSTHKKTFHLPLEYFEDARKYNPLEALRTCTKPKLFVRGTKDTRVTPEEIFEAFKSSANPKVYKEVHSEHGYRRNSKAIGEINEIVDNFLRSESI